MPKRNDRAVPQTSSRTLAGFGLDVAARSRFSSVSKLETLPLSINVYSQVSIPGHSASARLIDWAQGPKLLAQFRRRRVLLLVTADHLAASVRAQMLGLAIRVIVTQMALRRLIPVKH